MILDFQEPLTREEEEYIERIKNDTTPFGIQQTIREIIGEVLVRNKLLAQEVQ